MSGHHSPIVEMGPRGCVGERQPRALIGQPVRYSVETCHERFGARVMLSGQPCLEKARLQVDQRGAEGDDEGGASRAGRG